MAIFGLKPWKNVNFSTFRTFCFCSSERRSFVLEYRKRHFLGLYCLKRKVGKMAIFGPKPWVKHFGKMSIFRLFKRFVFEAQKGVFSFQNIVKDIFLAYITSKKKLEKWPFLHQNHGLTPLEKCQFFDLLNFLFLQARKAFFRSRVL